MSYPTEDQKGMLSLWLYLPNLSLELGSYIALFWAIWSMGAVVGSIIPTVDNWNGNDSGTVRDGTYIALFILMMCGSFFALFLVRPSQVIRDDGTKVFLTQSSSLITELRNLPKALKREPFIILFFPYSFCGLWYIPYQSNDYNSYFFNVRSRVSRPCSLFDCSWSQSLLLRGSTVFGITWRRWSVQVCLDWLWTSRSLLVGPVPSQYVASRRTTFLLTLFA